MCNNYINKRKLYGKRWCLTEGIVKWFDDEKGYGFIEYLEHDDVFVHYSSIIDNKRDHKSLIKGEYVEFDLVRTDSGYKAKNVTSKK